MDRCVSSGGVGLIVPDALLTQRYATPLRKRWIARHQITEISESYSFPTAAVHVRVLAVSKNNGRALSLHPKLMLETSLDCRCVR